MAKHKQPQGMAEGIYFNLSNEAYHADPALSHSGMTKLLISWQDYWVRSILNPARGEYKPSEAMITGTLTGELLLEGEQFHMRYGNYEKDGTRHQGKYLSGTQYTKIRTAVDAILEVAEGKEYFTNGYPEVSIFWRDEVTGIMLRARIDYLRIFGAIDFKRIMAVDNWSIGRAVKAQGLDIQCYLYLEAIKAARRMLKSNRGIVVHDEGVDPEWLNAFAKDEDLWFRFVFQRSEAPYIWEIREMEADVMEEGERATLAAVHRYKTCLERWGVSKPPMADGKTKSITSFHVPRRDYDYEEN